MSRRRGVLVTRPEPGLSETLATLAEMGFAPVPAPLLSIRPLRPAVPEQVQAVLLTSGQAAAPLAALAPGLCGRPVLAVGDATAARARAAGFERVDSASGDAARLAGIAAARLDPRAGPLLLACGQGQGRELAAGLRRAGLRTLRRCVYAARPAWRLPDPALDALGNGGLGSALFFSADTAAVFVRVLPPSLHGALGSVRAVAISPHAAEPLRRLSWRSVTAAAAPNAAALLALLDEG